MKHGKLAIAFVSANALLSAGTVAAEVTFGGEAGLALGNSSIFSSNDGTSKAELRSATIDGSVWARINGWVATFDAYSMSRDDKGENFDDLAPHGVSSIGLHFGREFGRHYAGVFYGLNHFQGDDAPGRNGYLDGTHYGIEGAYAVSDAVLVYGHYGRADMRGDELDTGFTGEFSRLGASVRINEKMSALVQFEGGKAPGYFEDFGPTAWGEYDAITVAGNYQFSERLVGTVSYSQMSIIANTEDNGTDSQIYLGARVMFGEKGNDRGNLSTSYLPGLVAAWAESLD